MLEYPEEHSVLHHGDRDGFPDVTLAGIRAREKFEKSEDYELVVEEAVFDILEGVPCHQGKNQ